MQISLTWGGDFVLCRGGYIKVAKIWLFEKRRHRWSTNRVHYKLDGIGNNANNGIRGFIMSKQKFPGSKCYPQWVLNLWTSDSKSNTLLSELIWHVLLRRSLNFCLCTTWFLDLNDLVRINREWLYKQPKVSVLQANAKLVQKGECWNQRSRGLILTGEYYFVIGIFCVHIIKPLMPILVLLPILSVCKKKTRMLVVVWMIIITKSKIMTSYFS